MDAQNDNLISVVVPAFNVGPYLEQCIASLLAQDYEAFEIVCIDDGSTDETGKLLDSLAEMDSRIKVHHFQNAGLSEARNRGVDLARGQYVTFVDADDFVSPHYLRTLAEAMDGRSDRFVKGMPAVGSRSALDNMQWMRPGPPRMLTTSEGIDMVLEDKAPESSWACLAPHSAYKAVRFPRGKLHEDTSTVMELIWLFSEFVVIDEPIYAYVVRQGSIMNADSKSMRQVTDYCAAVDKMQSFVMQHCPEKLDLLAWHTALCYTRCYSFLDTANPDDLHACELKTIFCDYVRSVIPDLAQTARRHSLSTVQFIRFALFAISPKAGRKAAALYKALRNLHLE